MQVSGPSWSLRRGSPLEREARLDAVRSALIRARDYAGALGATLGDPLELSDTDAGLGQMPRMFAMSAPGGGATEPQLDLEPQPQTVTADVTARFELKNVPAADALPT